MSERQTIGGRYVLERKLAGGGMGTIWVALDPKLQRRVAVKLMASHAAPAPLSRQQFEWEAQAIARLQNPHVIQVHDCDLSGDTPYIVMELLEGEDLEALLNRRGRLSLAMVERLLTQSTRALTAAHAAGVIHRDLKPANLFLARTASGELVKVLDFGLALLMSGGAAKPHPEEGMAGTPRYMSPEQLRGIEPRLDHRCDLWALAVVAYRALTGQHPFPLESLRQMRLGNAPPPAPAPSSLVPELGAEMDAFFARALDPDPARRFQSAHELASAFTSRVEAGRPSRPAKILVVDDEPDVVVLMEQSFRKQIRRSVYEFLFAADGEEALEQLRQHPDTQVVLCDINMPRMDGLTFLSRIGEVTSLTRVVIVSAYGDMNNIRTAMNRGAYDFITKPIDFPDLEATLVKTLKHVRELRSTVRSTEENGLLRMFVPGGVLERLPPLLQGSDALAGERVEGTVVFIDVDAFTPVFHQEAPAESLRRLNANFEAIVPELLSRGGTVDKFVGDAVMTVFRGPGHVDRAMEACLSIRRQLGTLADRGGEHAPYAHGVCIGLDSGDLVSGSVGAKASGRLDFTVLGDVVNTAARLAALASRGQVLVSARARERSREPFEYTPLGEQLVPGVGTPMELFALVRREGDSRVAPDEPTPFVASEPPEEPGTPGLAALPSR
ncbi:protein kinase domain-containing protein [Pyxidicoccus xibeiensis]|uniref:protein kinase domain-containing protein n=1 Tax=Pyxidicoccus xibeiensis TaxID=2906759 RepID=UPI0020A6EE0F|nr:response regulator [Pyxidicoccus xibeiensis]MCP3137985.1 response regulator [Pyxidicoccus xibeiensis]